MHSSWGAPLPAFQALPINDYITFAHRLADAAGDAIRPYFKNTGEIEAKGDHSPVTRADKAAETAIRDLITLHYPEHGIYGEEHGQHGLDKTYVWVIDPIDGTRNFIAHGTQWGTLIALCENGIPILGILDQPITGERWVGGRGQTTTLNGEPISTRACKTLNDAIISSTFCAAPDRLRYDALAAQCASSIEGGDCYAYGMLARGERDIVCDTALKPYDILALVPIIEGAGGKITGWDGTAIHLKHFSAVIAAGDATLHANALEILRQTA